MITRITVNSLHNPAKRTNCAGQIPFMSDIKPVNNGDYSFRYGHLQGYSKNYKEKLEKINSWVGESPEEFNKKLLDLAFNELEELGNGTKSIIGERSIMFKHIVESLDKEDEGYNNCLGTMADYVCLLPAGEWANSLIDLVDLIIEDENNPDKSNFVCKDIASKAGRLKDDDLTNLLSSVTKKIIPGRTGNFALKEVADKMNFVNDYNHKNFLYGEISQKIYQEDPETSRQVEDKLSEIKMKSFIRRYK